MRFPYPEATELSVHANRGVIAQCDGILDLLPRQRENPKVGAMDHPEIVRDSVDAHRARRVLVAEPGRRARLGPNHPKPDQARPSQTKETGGCKLSTIGRTRFLRTIVASNLNIRVEHCGRRV